MQKRRLVEKNFVCLYCIGFPAKAVQSGGPDGKCA